MRSRSVALLQLDDLQICLCQCLNVKNLAFGGSKNEPPRGKTNNVVSEQVRHKTTCTSTEKS